MVGKTTWKRGGKDLNDLMDKLLTAFFGCSLDSLTNVEENKIPMKERIRNLLEFIFTVFIPDFMPAGPMFIRLMDMVFDLFSNHTFKEVGAVLKRNI